MGPHGVSGATRKSQGHKKDHRVSLGDQEAPEGLRGVSGDIRGAPGGQGYFKDSQEHSLEIQGISGGLRTVSDGINGVEKTSGLGISWGFYGASEVSGSSRGSQEHFKRFQGCFRRPEACFKRS